MHDPHALLAGLLNDPRRFQLEAARILRAQVPTKAFVSLLRAARVPLRVLPYKTGHALVAVLGSGAIPIAPLPFSAECRVFADGELIAGPIWSGPALEAMREQARKVETLGIPGVSSETLAGPGRPPRDPWGDQLALLRLEDELPPWQGSPFDLPRGAKVRTLARSGSTLAAIGERPGRPPTLLSRRIDRSDLWVATELPPRMTGLPCLVADGDGRFVGVADTSAGPEPCVLDPLTGASGPGRLASPGAKVRALAAGPGGYALLSETATEQKVSLLGPDLVELGSLSRPQKGGGWWTDVLLGADAIRMAAGPAGVLVIPRDRLEAASLDLALAGTEAAVRLASLPNGCIGVAITNGEKSRYAVVR